MRRYSSIAHSSFEMCRKTDTCPDRDIHRAKHRAHCSHAYARARARECRFEREHVNAALGPPTLQNCECYLSFTLQADSHTHTYAILCQRTPTSKLSFIILFDRWH